MIGVGVKIVGAGLIVWFSTTNAFPAVSEAWKARKAAVEAASSSAGMTAGEVTQRYLSLLDKHGVKNITKTDVEAIKDGDRWIVGATYEVVKKVYGGTALAYEFSVASDKKTLW